MADRLERVHMRVSGGLESMEMTTERYDCLEHLLTMEDAVDGSETQGWSALLDMAIETDNYFDCDAMAKVDVSTQDWMPALMLGITEMERQISTHMPHEEAEHQECDWARSFKPIL